MVVLVTKIPEHVCQVPALGLLKVGLKGKTHFNLIKVNRSSTTSWLYSIKSVFI